MGRKVVLDVTLIVQALADKRAAQEEQLYLEPQVAPEGEYRLFANKRADLDNYESPLDWKEYKWDHKPDNSWKRHRRIKFRQPEPSCRLLLEVVPDQDTMNGYVSLDTRDHNIDVFLEDHLENVLEWEEDFISSMAEQVAYEESDSYWYDW